MFSNFIYTVDTTLHRDEAFVNYTTYGFAIDAVNATPALFGVLDSSLSGGTTPVQIVRTPLPTQTREENGRLKFHMQVFLDHSITEVSDYTHFVRLKQLFGCGAFIF